MSGLKVKYAAGDGVAVITIDDPDARNALSRAVREGLREAFIRFGEDDGALVAILTGAGDRAFCAGAHLKEMAEESVGIPPADYVPIVNRNLSLDKPLLAAVNGAALGGGFMLAQQCDLVLAAEHAVFGMPEVRWSRGAPWSVPLRDMIPQRIWMELALTGEPISAQRAYQVGLVNEVVAAGELMPAAHRLAGKIVANAPLTVRASRQMIRKSAELSLSAAWDEADRLFAPVYSSQDAQEGPRAFREKRAPRWSGR